MKQAAKQKRNDSETTAKRKQSKAKQTERESHGKEPSNTSAEGTALVAADGEAVGSVLGVGVGAEDGSIDGTADGEAEGMVLGEAVGAADGSVDGITDGCLKCGDVAVMNSKKRRQWGEYTRIRPQFPHSM